MMKRLSNSRNMERSDRICALALHSHTSTNKIELVESPPRNLPRDVEETLSSLIDEAFREEELEESVKQKKDESTRLSKSMIENTNRREKYQCEGEERDSRFVEDEFDNTGGNKDYSKKKISEYFHLTNQYEVRNLKSLSSHLENNSGTSNIRSNIPTHQTNSSGLSTQSNTGEFTDLKEKYIYLDGKFFKILEVTENKYLKTQCILCIPKFHIIKGIISVSTNFLKHIKKIHPGSLEQYKAHLCSNKYNSSKRKIIDATQDDENKKKKLQTNIPDSFRKIKYINQDEFDRRILRFIVHSMSPLNILDNEYFIEIFQGLDLSMISRKKAVQKINEMNKEQLQLIKCKLEEVEYVCTTTDIWSSKKKSYLGVTCHWLGQNLERTSVALACKRFSGTHSYYRIAEQLDEIYNKFGLTNKKIIATTTDNGSNFVKAFQEFGLKLAGESEDEMLEDEKSSLSDENNDEESNEPQFIEIEKEDEDALDESPSDSPNQVRLELSNHKRCASHTLNLIAVSDVKKAIDSNAIWRGKHTSVMNKCSLLWKKSSYPKSAEQIKEHLGNYLSYPGATRWNSLFDSIQQILRHSEKLNDLMQKLDIKTTFRESEIQYLRSYCQILAPIASALDILQGEKNCYYGYLLPCLISLKVKLIKLKQNGMINSEPARSILKACIEGLNKRFQSFLEVNHEVDDAILATFSIPQFKLRWYGAIANDASRDLDSIKKMITTATAKMVKVQEKKSSEMSIASKFIDKFFDFEPQGVISQEGSQNTTQPSQSLLQEIDVSSLEILRYLEDQRTDLTVIEEFPTIKKLFLKYNTPLPSSAPVERMFSFASIVNAPRRHALSDINFENLVLLKANGNIGKTY